MNISPSVILVTPQMGENIGAAARAMANFGLTDLRLVNPRDSWPNERAQDLASGAFESVNVSIFENFKDSIQDMHFTFATTSRSRDIVKPIFTPVAAIKEMQKRKEQRIGFVFGAERTGLENEDFTMCNATIHIPTNPDFPSINLAQAVLLLAYEWSKNLEQQNAVTDMNTPATQAELDMFINRLESDLEDRRFYRTPHLRSTVEQNVRNIFKRMDLKTQELKTLHGMLSALRGNKKGD
ncbi:MAG: TrmJ/YjtD family RNA methyltransferase [Alphaproteobacteria bacterium]|nr:TrmJ/YjtD family RNA methyltransferase [Alphaproteobacteria bacterium]